MKKPTRDYMQSLLGGVLKGYDDHRILHGWCRVGVPSNPNAERYVDVVLAWKNGGDKADLLSRVAWTDPILRSVWELRVDAIYVVITCRGRQSHMIVRDMTRSRPKAMRMARYYRRGARYVRKIRQTPVENDDSPRPERAYV